MATRHPVDPTGRPSASTGHDTPSGPGAFGPLAKVLEVYARNLDRFPLGLHLLIVFGVIFVMSILAGARDAPRMAIISGTLLLAYIALLLPHRRLFRLDADARRLVRFLGLSRQHGDIRFFLASFPETEANDLNGAPFSYVSLARSDVDAVIEMVTLLARYDLIDSTQNIGQLLVDEHRARSTRVDSVVYVGGPRVTRYVAALVDGDPVVSLVTEDRRGELHLEVAAEGGGRRYTMRPPSPVTGRSVEDTWAEPTYGCIMKRVAGSQVRFAIWGLDARGTVAAAHWLATNWSSLPGEFEIDLEEPFTAIVEIPPESEEAARPQVADAQDGHRLLLPVSSSPSRVRA